MPSCLSGSSCVGKFLRFHTDANSFEQPNLRAIREYYETTGYVVGFKPAGGIRTAKDACTWLILIKEELGDLWLTNKLFRIGASGLLLDIERQLFHYVTGRYAAAHELALS